jgi:hypothetical protein
MTKSIKRYHNANGLVEVSFSRDVYQQLEDEFSQPINLASNVNQQIAHSQAVFDRVIGPEGVAELARLASLENGEGATLFHIPFERSVTHAPRPGEPAHLAKSTGISERIILALSRPYGFAYANGLFEREVIGHLIPRPEAVKAYTGQGSALPLSFHREAAALAFLWPGLDLSPRAILLAGVSAQQIGGPTTPIVIVSRAVRCMAASRMGKAQVDRLRRRCAYLKLAYRNRRENGINRVGPVPILLGAEGREECCGIFYPDMVEFADPADEEAFRHLGEALQEVAINLRIAPGIAAALGNGAVLHARSAFLPRFDAEGRAERWVERLLTHGRPESLFHFPHNGERVFQLAPPG